MSVDFLLLERPVRQFVTRHHQIYSGKSVLQFEVVRLSVPSFTLMSILQNQTEEGFVVPLDLVSGQHGNFLVSSETGRGDIMGHEVSVGHNMEQLNNIIVADDPATASLGKGLGGEDNPVVVFVFVRVSCDLLA